MEHCATCGNWNPVEDHLGLGICKIALLFGDATERDGESLKFIQGHEKTKAFVQDGYDYEARLLTAPDFGCVSHDTDKRKVEI